MAAAGKKGPVVAGVLLAIVAGTAVGVVATRDSADGPAEGSAVAGPLVTVYKSATCACCAEWIEHLEANGFAVEAVDTDDMTPIKVEHGITGVLASCHTAVVDGYVIEGHVPADLIQRLLSERPEVAGLAVPGMPMGSPGMEGPRKDPYDVLIFDETGQTEVYASR